MATQPVLIEFTRAGGAFCRLTVSAWPATGTPTLPVDVAVLASPKKSPERASLQLPPGNYTVVGMVDVIEAVSGTFDYSYTVDGTLRATNHGDVNQTHSPTDMKIFSMTFNITVI